MIPLSVLGIRFDQFSPAVHSCFSFSEEQLNAITLKIRKQTRSEATLVLATCDRVEVWCEKAKVELREPVLRALSLPVLTWTEYTYSILGDASVDHLFSLACGLLSPLFGEDQIISQLHMSLQRSRLNGCASPLLEYLFREAVTIAKTVQDEVDLQVPDESLAEAVRALLVERKVEKRVLLIGSSALSRLVGKTLSEQGFLVTMTFRDLEKADLLLPKGVQAVSYEERFCLFSSFSVVLSATKGMGYTVDLESPRGPKLFIDLAPVKDIDPKLAGRDGVEILSLADFSVPLPRRQAAFTQAMQIINVHKAKVLQYLSYRQRVDEVQRMAIQAANDLVFRLHNRLDLLSLDTDFRMDLHETARKVFSHQLYQEQKRRAHIHYYDLSMLLQSGQASYAGDPDTIMEPFHTIEKDGWRLTRLSLGSHTGTHMDSPAHLLKNGKTLDSYAPSRFFATAYVMDCRKLSEIGEADLPDLVVSCDAILFCTSGAHEHAQLTESAAKSLLQRGIRLFGFDTPNCDRDGDLSFPIHHVLFSHDALIIENLINLDTIVSKLVDITCLPLFFKGADGAPTRVIATLENTQE